MKIPLDASPSVQQAFRDVDRVLAGWTGVGNVDLHGRKFLNGGAPTNAQDFVRKLDLEEALDGIQQDTADTATKELIIFDTHANRANYAPGSFVDRLYVEGDRLALYGSTTVAGVRTWKHLSSYMVGSAVGRPGDLGTYDEGFTFRQMDTDAGTVLWHWSGALWHYVAGTLKGLIAAIPAAADANIGALYHATDFDRLYVSNGLAWTDAPGQPKRGLQYFTGNPGTGWALCDGSIVTTSTISGGTALFGLPNLTSGNRFVRSNTTSGTTGGATSVDPPSTDSAGPTEGPISVDNDGAGSTVNVAPYVHTHKTDLAALATVPPYYDLIPFFRL